MTREKPPVPDPRERKKITFVDTEKRQVDFRIRLKYDGLTQSQFFRSIMTGYLDSDERIISFVEEFKQKYEIQGRPKRRKSRILRDKGKEVKRQFSLDGEAIENIFDIIEKEHPDL
jgi:hypothetical protein